ncbi:NAD P-binding protein [Gloeophyllum trabeum ATCC 11539]|uniref:NAD P-binding protein n=1 Tax=Gloeophyllum trabeum (strain ATCC 11539 / FP-39264 / Madison 617) TaxID=670483 RepID=S7RUF7_GLOTA|nr:NAD P-binding protein [Gloeophyllum trabeum ATCC 11539]EPQ56834.1 NAD P-binding protein [Gloeophyllum trabeum ATCC 11539]
MGLLLSVIDQNFPPKAKWGVDNIPDLSSKVIIVYLACRDQQKADDAIRRLKEETGRKALYLSLDLSDLESVKRAAMQFQEQEQALHILFNNAGVMSPPISALTKQGYDLQFGTNVLGHFYFTKLLLPCLKTAAQSSPDHVARVINTSSQTHVIGSLNFNAFTDTPTRRKMSQNALYAQSKFGNVVFSNELAKRYGLEGIMSVALHPGSLTTDLGRHLPPLMRAIIHSLCHTPPEGALTQLWGGTAPEAATLNGKYLIPWARIGLPDKKTSDEAQGAKLWEWCEEQVKDI